MRRRKPKPLAPGQRRYESETARKPDADPWKKLTRTRKEFWEWMETQEGKKIAKEATN